jgi:hypothetical protein
MKGFRAGYPEDGNSENSEFLGGLPFFGKKRGNDGVFDEKEEKH